MNCQLCLINYDHNKHVPYSMSCQHTICSGCISNIKRNKCPICNEIIRNKQVNQAILQRAPESHYDKLKNGYLNLYTKINDMKYSLNEKRNVKLKNHLSKIVHLKQIINYETEKFIQKIKENQMKLIDEADSLEKDLKSSFDSLTFRDDFDFESNYFKQSVMQDNLSEFQLVLLNVESLKTESVLKKLHSQVDMFDESYEFALFHRVDINNASIGEINPNKKV